MIIIIIGLRYELCLVRYMNEHKIITIIITIIKIMIIEEVNWLEVLAGKNFKFVKIQQYDDEETREFIDFFITFYGRDNWLRHSYKIQSIKKMISYE